MERSRETRIVAFIALAIGGMLLTTLHTPITQTQLDTKLDINVFNDHMLWHIFNYDQSLTLSGSYIEHHEDHPYLYSLRSNTTDYWIAYGTVREDFLYNEIDALFVRVTFFWISDQPNELAFRLYMLNCPESEVMKWNIYDYEKISLPKGDENVILTYTIKLDTPIRPLDVVMVKINRDMAIGSQCVLVSIVLST